ICIADLRALHSFPTRRSSDLDNKIVEEVGKRIGEHSKRLGVHINFAPVVDINANPKNPIIGNRSFGEDKENVTAKALAFLKGMRSEEHTSELQSRENLVCRLL